MKERHSSFDFTPVDALYQTEYHGPKALEALEIYWRSMLGALVPYRDTSNRPLGEEIAPDYARQGVEMQAVVCRYSGTRKNHELPMNLSALRQTSGNWHNVLNMIATIREVFCQGRKSDETVSMNDLWYISKICQLLPAYLLRCKKNKLLSGEIPIAPAVIYRIALGMHRIVHISLVRHMASGGDINSPCFEPERYYDIAEQANLFVGSISVCAAPKKMVIQAYQAMIDFEASDTSDECSLVKDASFYRYASLFMKLELEKYLFAVETAIQLRRLIEAVDALPESVENRSFIDFLLQFEKMLSEKTSPLAHEIAREDIEMLLQGDQESINRAIDKPAGSVRQSMIEGLNKLASGADRFCINALGTQAHLILEQVTVMKTAPVDMSLYSEDDFIKLGLSKEVALLVAEEINQYFQLENRIISILQFIQHQINLSLGYDDLPNLNKETVVAIFGPRLPQCFSEYFELKF